MATYSFLDIVAAIAGPGGMISLGNGSGAAEEGITVEMVDDKNTMMIGAGGQGQHNLHAGKGGTVTIRLLKTSPTNAMMTDLYNFQTASSARHGQNTFSLRDVVRGDTVTGQQGAFKKFPSNGYAKDGPVMEWVMDFVVLDQKIGTGTPAI
ncbi:hypothetical protein GCM10019059_32220 [Camelimonas fluminis]|uniref:Phage protein n=1 Tax=Camelimonas fluminis TaxID=1576911 RepID=A0ABV7UIC9_9HYPH|nr:phage protein [Camelimonas fluminis]GHE70012.1 hypothetical protein GCM10019059_32220 [Camelimonas fluminis]